jgi:hypothetical protein
LAGRIVEITVKRQRIKGAWQDCGKFITELWIVPRQDYNSIRIMAD